CARDRHSYGLSPSRFDVW
nr:immunoglobulin heavy chain junction region [Macaca mulatta]